MITRQAYEKTYQQGAQLVSKCATILLLGERGTGKRHVAEQILLSNVTDMEAARPVRQYRTRIRSTAPRIQRMHLKQWQTAILRPSSGTWMVASLDRLNSDQLQDLHRRLDQASQDKTTAGALILTARRKTEQSEETSGLIEELKLRLSPATLPLKPLREFPELIPRLVRLLIQADAQSTLPPVNYIDAQLIELLKQYHWPGNLRELSTIIHGMLAMRTGNRLTCDDLPAALVQAMADCEQCCDSDLRECEREYYNASAVTEPMDAQLADTERMLISDALRIAQFNRSEAARQLGISRVTLYNKMKRLGLTPSSIPS
ncbi:MAG: hypothetical protein KDA78_17910 [Planctomycetaceae bacterium]|nr:hypothetical protein [Planctomycetaceae bacterium]